MQIENQVQPSDPEHIKQLMEPGPDGPIFMVNLLKFNDKAEYEDGRETDLSGREAYMLYGNAVAEILKEYGGRIVFMADVTFLSLGKAEGAVGRGSHRYLSQARGYGSHVNVA